LPRPKSSLTIVILLLAVLQSGLAQEYRWTPPVDRALLAPTDSIDSEISGACLQGGLIDLRYGQASLDVGGTGTILDWNEATEFTLNGNACKATDLTDLLKEGSGLTVAVRHNSNGLIGWCDAIGATAVPAVRLTLEPWKPIMTPDERLVVIIDGPESKRLALEGPTLFAPGMTHGLDFQRDTSGRWLAELPIMSGWNWKALPLFVRTQEGKVFRGKSLSVSSTGPSIGETGPSVASDRLNSIPGWFELEGNLLFLDPTSVRLNASNGARITQVFPRRGRVDFTVDVVGSGTYSIEATVQDLVGREARKTWSFTVRR
jgi:hypothetical protein